MRNVLITISLVLSAVLLCAPALGSQALKLSFENNWDVHTDNYSNGFVTGPLLNSGDPANDTLTMEFDLYKDNWRAWQLVGDNDADMPVGGVHLNDNPGHEGEAWINSYESANPPDLTDWPVEEWIHVSTTFNSATDTWSATYTYGGTDHNFNGTNEHDIAPQFFFGGWMYKSQLDRVGADGGPFTESVLWLDNLVITTGSDSYSNDFDSETLGTVPAGWSSGQWYGGIFAGEAYCVVDPAPGDVPGDVDGNGVVDGLDLTAVLTAWETTPGDPLWNPNADLDGNGVVDGLDLTEVISNWTVATAPAPEAAASDTTPKRGRGKGNVKKK
jgi:hypothetical protein